MPEPVTDPNDLPGDIAAITPPAEAVVDKPTTQTIPEKGQFESMLEVMDLPDDIKAKLSSQAEVAEAAAPVVEEVPAPVEPEAPAVVEPEAIKDETDDEEEPIVEGKEVDWKKVADKRLKRINRLTRQKSEIETKLDSAFTQTPKTEVQTEKPEPISVPSLSGELGYITSEQQLADEVKKSNSIINTCDRFIENLDPNTDTLQVINDKGQPEVYDRKQIDGWRRQAEKVVINAPNRRDEIRTYYNEKNYFDNLAKTQWPELFNPSAPEYQTLNQIINGNIIPGLKSSPRAVYYAGLAIKGMKADFAEQQAKKGTNGQNGKTTKDIDPRVFTTPRVPVAPHSPGPPSRDSSVSSQNKYDEAMKKHLADPEGNHMAEAFAALHEQSRGKVGGRTAIRA